MGDPAAGGALGPELSDLVVLEVGVAELSQGRASSDSCNNAASVSGRPPRPGGQPGIDLKTTRYLKNFRLMPLNSGASGGFWRTKSVEKPRPLYTWLAQRLHRIDQKRGAAFVPWERGRISFSQKRPSLKSDGGGGCDKFFPK